MLLGEEVSPKQIEILRGMPGEQRLLLAERLYWSARKMKMAGLRAQHPDWEEERLKEELRRIFLPYCSRQSPRAVDWSWSSTKMGSGDLRDS